MKYNFCIDMANSREIIIKLINSLEAIPLINLKFQQLSEVPIEDTRTGEEVYRVYQIGMTSDCPRAIVSPLIKRLGFKQDKSDMSIFYK